MTFFPKMVKVRWKAYVANDEIPGYWLHCARQVWWVLGDCLHWTKPQMIRSRRVSGPRTVKCYECGRDAPKKKMRLV